MTDNHDHWSNPHGPANPGAAGGYPPQEPTQHQPAQPDPGQPAWGSPDPGQQGWGNPNAGQQTWGQPDPGQQGWGNPVTGAEPTVHAYNPQGWGNPDAAQQGWGTPVTGAEPTVHAYNPQAYQPNPQGYEPTQQFYPGAQSDPNFPGQQPVPGYGQPGYGQPTPPGGPNRTWLILAAVLGVIVLVGGGIAAYALTRGDSGGSSAAPSTTAGAAPTSKAGSPSSGPSTSGAPKSGSRTVVAPSLGISYDVPAGWTIAAPTQTTLQSGADGNLTGYAKSSEGADYCAGSAYRSLVFVAQVDGTDLAAAATKVAKVSVESGYDDPTGGKPGAPAPVTTKSGLAGLQVEASGPWKPTLPGCTTNAYAVYAFAFPGPRNSTLVLAVLADRGTTGEMTPDQAKQLIASVRTS